PAQRLANCADRQLGSRRRVLDRARDFIRVCTWCRHVSQCSKDTTVMTKTIEAVINQDGQVQLLESIQLTEARRALVTILDDAPTDESNLELGYLQMAQDEERESEALEWAEATLGDVADEPR